MEIASHHQCHRAAQWEFRRRVKTQSSLPDASAAERLLFGLIISGQIQMRRIDGWRDLKQVAPLKAA
jgi:hypothetical protein